MDDLYRSQFRLPYPLYEKLKAQADRSGRSVNAELVARLEQSFYEVPLPGLSTEDVVKVSHQVIKSLYTDFVPRSELEALMNNAPRDGSAEPVTPAADEQTPKRRMKFRNTEPKG